MKKYNKIETSFENFVEIDERFSTCSVKVMYVGKNRNGSFFTKETVEESMESLKNMPVVGEFKIDKDDFGSHGGEIRITDESIELVPTTRPYGVIPETFEHEWIEENLGDGRVKETLVVHGVILWTHHYKEAFNVLMDGSSQSMEIEVEDGFWNEEFEVYQINSFNFLSLCILGKDVEPAFENSKFFSSKQKEFKKEWDIMLKELSYSLSKKEDNILDAKDLNKLEGFEENTEPEVVVEPEVTEGDNPEVTVEPEATEPEVTEPETEVVEPEVTELGNEDVPDVIEPEQPETEVTEPTQTVVEDNSAEFEAKIAELNSIVETLTEENEELKQFKKDTDEANHKKLAEELFAKFSLSEEDVKDLDVLALSIAEVEEKCYAILGKKASQDMNFNLNKKEDNKSRTIAIDENIESKDSKYGELFEKYLG